MFLQVGMQKFWAQMYPRDQVAPGWEPVHLRPGPGTNHLVKLSLPNILLKFFKFFSRISFNKFFFWINYFITTPPNCPPWYKPSNEVYQGDMKSINYKRTHRSFVGFISSRKTRIVNCNKFISNNQGYCYKENLTKKPCWPPVLKTVVSLRDHLNAGNLSPIMYTICRHGCLRS